MAQGSVTVFDEVLPTLNFANSALTSTAAGVSMDTDTFKIALFSTAIASMPANQATPDYAEVAWTECSTGGGYVTGGATAVISVAESGGTLTIATTADVTWTSAGTGGPADIRTALLYSDTHTGSIDAVAVIDLTQDGTSPLDLDNGDITISAGTVFTIG